MTLNQTGSARRGGRTFTYVALTLSAVLAASVLPGLAFAQHGGGGGGHRGGGGWVGGFYNQPGLVYGSPYYCNPALVYGQPYPYSYGYPNYCD